MAAEERAGSLTGLLMDSKIKVFGQLPTLVEKPDSEAVHCQSS
jgi:hypothetical protein